MSHSIAITAAEWKRQLRKLNGNWTDGAEIVSRRTSWEPILDLSAPWMPTKWRSHRCGFPLKDGGFCQMRQGHYAKVESDHGKPDYWRSEKRCPNRDNHTPGVIFEYTSMESGHHVFKATGKPASKTHVQRQCDECGLYLIWEPKS